MNVLELIERAHVEVDFERGTRRLQAKLLEAEATRDALHELLDAYRKRPPSLKAA